MFAHDCPKWEFCVMNGIAFRLSIVCYDRLFSRKCSHLSIQAIRLFFKISGGGFFIPFFPIFLMFLHLRVDCLIIENLETLESDRDCSISVHFSRSLVILSRFDKKNRVTELGYGTAWCRGTTWDLQVVGTQFVPVSLDVSWAWNLAWYSEFVVVRYKVHPV